MKKDTDKECSQETAHYEISMDPKSGRFICSANNDCGKNQCLERLEYRDFNTTEFVDFKVLFYKSFLLVFEAVGCKP